MTKKKKDRRAHPRRDLETAAEVVVEEAAGTGKAAAAADSKGGADQREHERVSVAYEINIEAGLRLGGQEVMRLTLVGTTIDISRGGMLIRVDQDVIPGARCEVRFPAAAGQIKPERTVGRVRRSIAVNGGFHLAVQFDEPLAALKGDS